MPTDVTAAAIQDRPKISLLKCPVCAAPLDPSGTMACCGNDHSRPDGIIDFVGGRSNTALDVDADDDQKQVSIDASVEYFSYLKRSSNGAIGDDIGNVLEIGAGTGLLTIGMLAGSRFDSAVITDISPQMLQICKRRVGEKLQPLQDVQFATFSGDEDIFADGTVDLCVANSVLHHVSDYPALLAKIKNALKPGGKAIFVEPGAAYHDALSHAMSDTLCSRIAYGQMRGLGDSAKRISTLITDIRSRIAFAHDKAYIAQLEDKYIFSRQDLSDAAEEAGFSASDILPFFEDPKGERGVQKYLRELAMTPAFIADFMPLYLRYADYYFRDVEIRDECEVYLVVFTKAP